MYSDFKINNELLKRKIVFMDDSTTEFWLTMHPNAAGYLIIESILKEQLKKVI